MSSEKNKSIIEKVVSLCKRRGFVFQGSEIYGGLAGVYDYGPLGIELRNNIKQYFWDKFVKEREDVYGLGAAILMPARVWEASGHTELFTDPLVECKLCQERVRADQPEAIQDHEAKHSSDRKKDFWSEPKKFNLLVSTKLGASDKTASLAYLRGEITQGVQVNFKNVFDSMHPKFPFGIGQIGKAFRNEITPRDFLFRQREFEQMELQYYTLPEKEAEIQFEFWKQFSFNWYLGLGFKKENLRLRQHASDERAHYAKDAWDIEYNVLELGWKEAWGIHNRGDWDLKRHSEFSGVDLSHFDEATKERFIPWDVECSGGVDRAVFFVLLESYMEDEMNGETRTYLKFAPHLAPIKVAVFPLLKNKPELIEKAREIFITLKNHFNGNAIFDDNGNIGKRYRRQDEIGTPFCVTIDFETLKEETVTVRDRDTGQQEKVKITELENYLNEKFIR
jgi:glycyl-tRNA synthetase